MYTFIHVHCMFNINLTVELSLKLNDINLLKFQHIHVSKRADLIKIKNNNHYNHNRKFALVKKN